MKKILVTGGAGYIGIHTVYSLLEAGYFVIILDSLKNSSYEAINNLGRLVKDKIPDRFENIEFFKGDIRDNFTLNDIFAKNKKSGKSINGVIHFAGLKSVPQSLKKPTKYWDVNVCGTINLIKVMDLYDCRKLIFSSSASIYGNSTKDLISEEDEIKPIHPYGFTKASIENFLENLSLSKNKFWSICSLRYFNPTGAHPSGLIGEDPKNDFNNIFPIINKVGSQENAYLNIYGNDWPTRDGTCIRDYIHVMDLSDAHIIALEHLFRGHTKGFLTLNIGTGQGVSLLELVRCFQNVNNIKIPYVFSERRDGDVASLVANNSKAERIIGWTPSRTLEDMCVDAWNWKCLNH